MNKSNYYNIEQSIQCYRDSLLNRERIHMFVSLDLFSNETPIEKLKEVLISVEETAHNYDFKNPEDCITLRYRRSMPPGITWMIITEHPENYETRMKLAGSYITKEKMSFPEELHFGTVVENKTHANSRLRDLLIIPAAGHFAIVRPTEKFYIKNLACKVCKNCRNNEPFFTDNVLGSWGTRGAEMRAKDLGIAFSFDSFPKDNARASTFCQNCGYALDGSSIQLVIADSCSCAEALIGIRNQCIYNGINYEDKDLQS